MPPRRSVVLSLILSCEHASGRVPTRFAGVFASRAARAALGSHRGLDLGALALAQALAKRCQVPLLAGQQTRLLIDLNRSVGHRNLLSEWSRRLSTVHVQELKAIHAAHWAELASRVRNSKGTAIHVSVHSFTPVLAGKSRDFDVGLLYDPRRPGEVALAGRLHIALSEGGLRTRRNAPYRGSADGAPTSLRRQFSPVRYVGLELELNQAFLWHEPDAHKRRAVLAALTAVLPEFTQQ